MLSTTSTSLYWTLTEVVLLDVMLLDHNYRFEFSPFASLLDYFQDLFYLPFLLISAVLTLVNLVERISGWDLEGIATMNTLLKYGSNVEIVTGLIYMTCMKKQ